MDRDAFTEDGWRAFEQASAESRLLGHGYLGTEHLLLGVLAVPDGVGARALAELGVTLAATRAQVIRIVGRGDGVGTDGVLPWTPRALTAATKRAPAAARRGRRAGVASEDLLLGVVAVREGVGARILEGDGADRDRVREVVARVGGGGG